VTGTTISKVVVLAVHPPRVAATRLRASQYVPYWEAAGLQVDEWSFLRERDLDDWYGPSQLRRAIVLLRALLRLPLLVGLVRGACLVLVQREALPLGPPVVELLSARGRRLVWDVDDAVWESFDSPTAGRVPQWLRATGGKYQRLCRRADAVWAGSEVLARWCRQHSERVELVPTVVPVAPERRPPPRARTVGWVGSHSTGPFLEAVLPAVAEVSPPPEVLVVGAAVTVPEGLPADVHGWSQDVEDSTLASTRVGLYPVDRSHALAEGKCGLKAILYMSHGIPCVVTPTATNAAVVRHGVEGLHADAPGEWTSAVQHLLDDDDLHERMSAAAHARAREHFSLQAWGPRLASRLRALTEGI
jgi:glycosyltransferase involved in cell wall biosynthesis